MSRRILSALLALLMVVGFTAMTKADVTGSFDIHIALNPEGNQTEAVKFFIDFQSNLQVNVTLSGLTFSADLGFGTTGVEFAILGLTTNLGALAIHDDFVFAPPFGCANFPAAGQCAGIDTFPIGDGDGDGVVDNAVGFVKKRIEMELNIAGITLTNLALFEDVDFPDIQGGGGHEHDHFGPGSTYNVGQNDAIVDNQTPTYGFGDVITLSGQTVSGITVTGSTTICASGRNYIKKRSWPYEVNKACTSGLGFVDPEFGPIEDGAKTPLLFEEETLSVEGVVVGSVTLDVYTAWHPNDDNGFLTDIIASFSLLDLADVVVTMSSDNITSLSLSKIVVAVSSGNLSLTLTDTGGNLSIDKTVAVLSVVLNPNQNPADLTVAITAVAGTGVTLAAFSLGISRGALSLDTTTVFAGAGTLDWVGTSFSLSVDTGSGISFGAEFEYTPAGMGETTIELGVTF